jgi:hypothetical protein
LDQWQKRKFALKEANLRNLAETGKSERVAEESKWQGGVDSQSGGEGWILLL